MQTIAQCNLTAIGGRVVILTAIQEADRITFTGGNCGDHTISIDSSKERIKAHFDGYCENRARGGLMLISAINVFYI